MPYSPDLDRQIPNGAIVPGVVVAGVFSGDRADVRCAARADQRTRWRVADAIGKMLLNDEPGCARAKRVLVAAQKCSGARFGNRVLDLSGSWLAPSHIPDADHVTFTIGDRDHAPGQNLDGAGDSMVDNCLNIRSGQLRER